MTTYGKDIVALTSTVIVSTVTFNFGLRAASKLDPELMEFILGSAKLERFAEGSFGYYQTEGVTDTFQVAENSLAIELDVLSNDVAEMEAADNISRQLHLREVGDVFATTVSS